MLQTKPKVAKFCLFYINVALDADRRFNNCQELAANLMNDKTTFKKFKRQPMTTKLA